VSKLPDGRYKVRAAWRDPQSGKTLQRELTLELGATQREAVQARADLLVLMQAGSAAPTKAHLLDDYAASWLARKADRLRKRVCTHYADVLDLYILPRLGKLDVREITRADIEGWVIWAEQQRKKDGERYSVQTLGSWWRILKQIVRDAGADHERTLDPCARVSPPQGERGLRREQRTLSLVQLGELLRAVKALTPERYAEVLVLALTGMRGGELFGLHWQDLDEERKIITIRYSAARGELVATKTGDPRESYLPELALGILRAHRREQLANQHPGLARGLIFPSDTGGLRYVSSLHKPLAAASEEIKLGWTVGPQVLRRSYNTLLIAAGVDRIVLRAQIGHCDEEMSERYAGIGEEIKHEQIGKVFALLL
jgi:integrase